MDHCILQKVLLKNSVQGLMSSIHWCLCKKILQECISSSGIKGHMNEKHLKFLEVCKNMTSLFDSFYSL